MNNPTFALEPVEADLLAQAILDAGQLTYEVAEKNGNLVVQLMAHLGKRNAIPAHRINYFIDPEFSGLSRNRSWKQVFERNGTRGEEILRHPHFLRHLRYFLYGPDLPDTVKEAFAREVASCGNVTSGDVDPLSKFARRQARSYRMNPAQADDEFYKLALECGMSPNYSSFVKRAVRSIRYTR